MCNNFADTHRLIFDQYVLDDQYAAIMHHGAPYVSYIVLADMIRAGWRLTAKPVPEPEPPT